VIKKGGKPMDTYQVVNLKTLLKEISNMVQLSYFDAKQAHDLISEKEDNKKIGALAYLNKATSSMVAAKCLCFTHFDEIYYTNDMKEVFTSFDLFANEIIQQFTNMQRYQQVNHYFLKFKETFEDSIFNTTITDN